MGPTIPITGDGCHLKKIWRSRKAALARSSRESDLRTYLQTFFPDGQQYSSLPVRHLSC